MGTSYLQGTVLMESEPSIACPPKVCPVREAEVSPHTMPVSWVLNWRIMRICLLQDFLIWETGGQFGYVDDVMAVPS